MRLHRKGLHFPFQILRFCKKLFFHQPVLPEIEANRCPLAYRRRNRDINAEVLAYAAAEIKPEPARTAVGSAVASGIAFVKHARQILRRDAYSGVFDTKDFSLGINLYAPLAGIFERV